MTRETRKIAIIGTGISGLGAMSLLAPHHDVTVYEKNDYIGGHSRTIEVCSPDGVIPVDTGFIVFNKRNYPLLTRLFEYFQVPIVESDMSFGVSIKNGWLEYGTQNLGNFFAQKRNFLRPAFWRMLVDILKFNRLAHTYLSRDTHFTLHDCLEELGMRPWFQRYFLLAMGGAIWSTPLEEILKFPACTFVRFFENHGLLTVNQHPQWYTVLGGSREYVRRITQPFKACIHLKREVVKVFRLENSAVVEDIKGAKTTYDDVIFACHADQALAIIKDANRHEKEVLSAFRYQPNRVVVHSDLSFMPKRKKAWASWVYLSESRVDASLGVSLSYWMNNLQPLKTDHPIIVTLNPAREPDKRLVYNDHVFEHPIFDSRAIGYQKKIDLIQGQNRLWFCGAYQRYGFHEDGLESAVQMAKRMEIAPPW